MLSSLCHGTVSLLLFTVSPHDAENSCFKQVKKKVEKKEDFITPNIGLSDRVGSVSRVGQSHLSFFLKRGQQK